MVTEATKTKPHFIPIHMIPTELLEEIIYVSLHRYNIDHWTTKRLLQLCLVATRWRDVVISSTRLWAVINVKDNWELSLRRSGSSPLTIYLPVRYIPKEQQNDRMKELLVPHTYRIKRMSIIHSYGYPAGLFHLVENCHLPILEDLEISYNMFTTNIKTFDASKLRRLTFWNVSWQYTDSWPMPQLTHLDISRVDSEEGPTANELTRFLQGCPKLQVINLESLDNPMRTDDAPQDARIHLPDLTRLSTDEIHEVVLAQLLRRLDAPKLAEFHLVLNKEDFFDSGNPSPVFAAASEARTPRCPSILQTFTRNIQLTSIDVEVEERGFSVFARTATGSRQRFLRLATAYGGDAWTDNLHVWSFISTFALPTKLLLRVLPNAPPVIRHLPHLVEIECPVDDKVHHLLELLCTPEEPQSEPQWSWPRLQSLHLHASSTSGDTPLLIAKLLDIQQSSMSEHGEPTQLQVVGINNSRFNRELLSFEDPEGEQQCPPTT